MSKTSAAIAVLGAGAGASITAAMLSLRSSNSSKPEIPIASSSNATSNAFMGSSSSSSTPTSTIPAIPPPAPIPGGGSAPYTPVPSGKPVDPSGLFQYGFPGPVADLATRDSLVSSYDRRTRNPHWVAEHITPASLAQREADRKNSVFLEDPSIPPKFRALLKDYFRSGYDRGHQVPAADAKWGQKAMDDTFYLSNMCPQVGDGFNRDYWAHFEDFCRRLTVKYPSVRIVTGPLYLPKKDPTDNKWYVKYEMIGNPPSVAVPTHFYKVIFAEDGRTGGNVAVGAFVLPNAVIDNKKPITDFEVPLEAVERASGLDFASKLDMSRRRRLCTDTTCALVIKDYAKRQEAFPKK